MRSKHASDAAFEAWVTSGGGEHLLRTHTVQAAFREGWKAREATEYHDADDVACEGHEYQRRGSWSGDDWCAVEGCTSRGSQAGDGGTAGEG